VARSRRWFAVDTEAIVGAVRAAVKEHGSPVGPESLLQSVFLKIGWDKASGGAPPPAEDAPPLPAADEEDEEAAAPAPAPAVPIEVSNNAMDVWKVLVPGGEDEGSTADVREVMGKLAIRVKGYGEPQFKLSVALMDPDGASGVGEEGLWKAMSVCSAGPLEGIKRTHLRRVWRAADTWMPALPEEGEPGDEAAAAALAAAKEAVEAAKKQPRRIVVDSFFEKLGEDEYASGLVMKEIEVPKEDKPAEDAPAEDE
jgi:hypothetical protein